MAWSKQIQGRLFSAGRWMASAQVLGAALFAAGCESSRREYHYREDTRTVEPLGSDAGPREGDRRPGQVEIEEHRSPPQVIVE